MKRPIIEQKAKAYNEAIEKLGVILNLNTVKESGTISVDDIRKIFPELKESEDEKIRKQIISFLKEFEYDHYRNLDFSSWISWLEKQGEQKSAKNIVETWKDMRLEVYQQASGNRHESNCSDDTTKMFSLNDIDEIIEKMSEQKPVIEGTFVNVDEVREGFMQEVYRALYDDPTNDRANQIIDAFDHLPTIIIQKPADKVEPKFHEGEWIVWQNKFYKVNDNGCGYELIDQNGLSTSLEYGTVDKSASKFTIQDAKDGDVLAFYSEYRGNKIVQIGIIEKYVGKHGGCSNTFKIYVGVNWDNNLQIGEYMGCSDIRPATKEQRDTLEKAMANAGWAFDFEKMKLKKVGQKSAWSEEDEKIYQSIMDDTVQENQLDSKQIDWLKSLKGRYTWKPNEEQMKALNYVVNLMASSKSPKENDYYYNVFKDLRKQIKKLREE